MTRIFWISMRRYRRSMTLRLSILAICLYFLFGLFLRYTPYIALAFSPLLGMLAVPSLLALVVLNIRALCSAYVQSAADLKRVSSKHD